MTIGIIGAMDEEITLFKDIIEEKEEIEVANSLLIKGILHGKDVVLLKSGIGKVNAAMSTTIMFERFKPSIIINTGTAGGFDSDLNIGDVVISSAVVHHDVNVTAFDYDYGQIPGMPAKFVADNALIKVTEDALEEAKVNYKLGLIASADTFMADESDVNRARQLFPQMIAAEMEAAAVAQVCHQYDVPFVIIRSLSDIAGKESSLSFNDFIHIAAKNATDIVVHTIKSL